MTAVFSISAGYEAEGKPSVFSEVLRPRFKTTDERPIQVLPYVPLMTDTYTNLFTFFCPSLLSSASYVVCIIHTLHQTPLANYMCEVSIPMHVVL